MSINPGTNPLLLNDQRSGRSGNRTPNNMPTNRIINNYSTIKNGNKTVEVQRAANTNDNPRMNMTPQASNRMSSTISYFQRKGMIPDSSMTMQNSPRGSVMAYQEFNPVKYNKALYEAQKH